MATIYLRLSKRTLGDSDLCEVLIRVRNGKDYDLNAKSGIFVTPDNFRNGQIVVNRRKVGNNIEYHEQQLKRMNDLCLFIDNEIAATPKSKINSKWIKVVVDKFNNPDKYQPKAAKKQSFFELSEEYLSKKQFSINHTKAFRVLIRDVARYEGFVRATDKTRKGFIFDVDKVTKDDIEDFFDYLRNEYDLAKEYPSLFDKLLTRYPSGVSKGITKLVVRGDSTIVKLKKKLKAFFVWLYDTDKTSNRPFEGVEIGTEKYGTPFYISIDERNKIAETDLESKFNALSDEAKKALSLPLRTLEQQRDIFIFHCFVGCRVSDLIKLTDKNIVKENIGLVLVYTPNKTKDGEKPVQARVPLHPKAIALMEKYKGVDRKGRLFPFITPQKYNDAIKDVFTLSGITRYVEVRNPKTGDNELRPINEIASSHLARRTFVGNAYFKVSDPNIIGKMSGHVDGSKAFKRYRKIEDSTLKDVINQIG